MGENRAAVSVAVFSRFAIYANVVRPTRRFNSTFSGPSSCATLCGDSHPSDILFCMNEHQVSLEFEVEDTFSVAGRGVFVSARLATPECAFAISDGATLGGRPIDAWFDIPRRLDFEGRQRLDCYVFKLRRAEDRAAFEIGKHVTLKL
jgi:hypothetical protein